MQKIKQFLHNLFIPHERNNFRARSLHTDFLGLYLIFALVLSFSFKQIGLNNVLGFATDITVDKLFELTNQQRSQNGLSALTYNSKLAGAANQKAQDMFAKNYWAHYSPSGTTPWDFILNSGYQYEYAGENLAKNFLFSDGVVDAWMKSQTHRDNILKSEYAEVGYAIVNGILNGEQTTLVVQVFGKPANAQIANSPVINPQVEASEKSEAAKPQEIEVIPVENSQSLNKESFVLAKEAKKTFSAPSFSFNMNIVFFSFLLLSLALDFYFAAKFNIIRVGGKNLAHFIFILFMLAALFILKRGAIV
ncbi:MAG: hypothetical protein UR89_C0041G0007 [Candidatus Roizmanbacteria bacterium GW2011_GWA2_35_8]|uniref:SCP domain-containing protein n=1 Tax=Candidatus Roizmanbacteria bacterium GW2011_GWA2_35_8 TaxID=1618479 RepID=A0A0G0CVC8_9BACT|nr:MAG: hypothetical protein UR89_C0041G0007 [Candidatus Roizmanbacteria bacterium GW2011_GWA2_35_8]